MSSPWGLSDGSGFYDFALSTGNCWLIADVMVYAPRIQCAIAGIPDSLPVTPDVDEEEA
jgi:hypothetical protein